MYWKFFAFAMLVLIILMFIQFSTLSDKDVEKIRTQIELNKKAQQDKQAQGTNHSVNEDNSAINSRHPD